MKNTLTTILTLVASAAIAADAERSTTTTTTTTTVGNGTITEYTPGTTFVVKESSGPVKYRYGEKVVYVTRKGRTLSEDEVRTRIKIGAPVNVHYSTVGEDRVINRVEIDGD